ncbi:MAG: prolipoprotein diacylglyceryl transferase [Sedimentisphaerales bacterium]|nr:prolipoprotein diacylglyceryl transferase [Sedimentisphaerales bacterium]
MRPELFTLPFVHLSIKSYGTMMVIGFLAALLLSRWRARKLGENPYHITNFAVYVLLAGIVGARLMYILHNWSEYQGNPFRMLAIWAGGLEFLGGVVCAVLVVMVYLKWAKLPVLRYLDILAPALMLGLAFGRMGCFLNGCCFGKACELPWAIRYPALNTLSAPGCDARRETHYSNPYLYQLTPDPQRPDQPVLELPADFYNGYTDGKGWWIWSKQGLTEQEAQTLYPMPKAVQDLDPRHVEELRQGRHPMHPIHPAQLYSVLNALFLCLILNLLFRRYRFGGQIIAVMLILYGASRFFLETLRTEPIEFDGLTISQNLGIIAVLVGLVLLIVAWGRRDRFALESNTAGPAGPAGPASRQSNHANPPSRPADRKSPRTNPGRS